MRYLWLSVTVSMHLLFVASAQAQAPSAKTRAGVWISKEEIARLPMAGTTWDKMKEYADQAGAVPKLSDQNETTSMLVLAKAYVYARTGNEKYRTEVRRICLEAVGTEKGGRTLALGRKLAGYVVAADVVKLEPEEDRKFRAWLRECLTEDLAGRTLRSTHEDRPNNWGTHAGASRLAVAVYLGDKEELAKAAKVFKGWLGDRAAYAGFKYGDLSWQADPKTPRGVNPKGATKEGKSIDGVVPDDLRRGGGFKFPPSPTKYAWGALEGAVVQAEILARQGYDSWSWEDQAMRRAVQFLFDLNKQFPDGNWWPANDSWIVCIVNRAYGTSYPVVLPARPGRNISFTDWTHQSNKE